jgi:Dephospho-CoA kinase
VGITAPADMRIKRLMQRENISEEYAAMRINAQKPDKFFEDNCDYILSNDSTIEVFVNKCENLFSKLIDNDLI